MHLKALEQPTVWYAVIGVLVVHPSPDQALVPGLTVFGTQLVDQQLILCTKRSLLTTLLLRSHEVSLNKYPAILCLMTEVRVL